MSCVKAVIREWNLHEIRVEIQKSWEEEDFLIAINAGFIFLNSDFSFFARHSLCQLKAFEEILFVASNSERKITIREETVDSFLSRCLLFNIKIYLWEKEGIYIKIS